MIMLFAIVNESTSATASSAFGGELTPEALDEVAKALDIYVNRDVASHWGGNYMVRVADKDNLASGEIVCAIMDAMPDVPQAVAYHSVDGQACPFIVVGRVNCASIMDGPSSISNALAHELVETIGDPGCNRWADEGDGVEHAFELADATQADSYKIGNVSVSNFLLPSYFVPGGHAPYSYLGIVGDDPIPGTFATATGGYQILRSPGTGEHDVFAKRPFVNGVLTPESADRKKHPLSRTHKRGVRLGEPSQCKEMPKYNEDCFSCLSRQESDQTLKANIGTALGAAIGAMLGRSLGRDLEGTINMVGTAIGEDTIAALLKKLHGVIPEEPKP